MTSIIVAAVLAAAALHAGWNTIVKSSGSKLVGAALLCFGSAVVALPLLVVLPMPAPPSLPYIVLSGFVHAAYVTFLGLAYRHADLSVAYPVMRGAVPLITVFGAAMWLGEWLPPFVLSGVLLLSAGVLWLAVDGLRKGGLGRAGLVFAATNAFVIAGYSLIDGAGARLSGHAFSYNAWVGVASAVCFAPVVIWRRGAKFIGDVKTGWRIGLVCGAMGLFGYSIVLWAMTKAPIGAVVALRETSIIFGAFFGAVFLKERFGQVRYIATLTVAVGVILMRM